MEILSTYFLKNCRSGAAIALGDWVLTLPTLTRGVATHGNFLDGSMVMSRTCDAIHSEVEVAIGVPESDIPMKLEPWFLSLLKVLTSVGGPDSPRCK